MKKFSWNLVSSGRLGSGEMFSVSIKKADGELWDNPIEPEQLMLSIEFLLADERVKYVVRQYAELDDTGKKKINDLMDALLALKESP